MTCKDDEQTFVGKEGLNEIADKLDIWFTYKGDKKRRKATTVKKINEVLEELDLPFMITTTTRVVKIKGTQKTKSYKYYTIKRLE